ncbi:linear amide C-N hydrolase [Thiomonas intermedia]|uniref:linear amide C-N hydrolase n=1 Tax=Thiomonas intermedia TaxID=926 RepID=UPI0012AB9E4D|nr:linear amide C-N hydrolase [Thiomonas intermedia]
MLASTAWVLPVANACTRMVYHGEHGLVVTGRTMDWRDEIPASLWIMPRGLTHDGGAGADSVHWTSRFGSVVTSSFGFSTVDGMNEKGLVANMLWLAGTRYPETQGAKNQLSVAAWVQYFLDNFATVDEAVKAMQADPVTVVSSVIPGTNRFATLHLSISDAQGDSAIFEYINGKLLIHHGRQYQVMTNDPSYDEQLAIQKYWQDIGGTTFLPGTNRSADRFARASFYIHAIPKTANPEQADAQVMSVLNNVSVPMGITTPGQPNISNTRWRTVADQTTLRYYFQDVETPNAFWVDLKQANLKVGAPVLRLRLEQQPVYAGNVLKDFKPAQPLKFLSVEEAEAARGQ